MESGKLTIGALAGRAQCTVPTIRYYEEIGLLPPAPRSANGRRYYSEADQKRLLFIKRCRDFGFPIDQVRDLVSMFENGDRSCVEVRDMAQDHLTQVRAKIGELRQLEESLLAFVQGCDEACIGGTARDCTIIEDLSSQPPTRSTKSCCSGTREGVGENSSGIVEVRRR
ncbi:helix-turn-helix domain-containing protein [Herbaspirillum sp. ST 5-3]|uniref:MerR family transcriptional regulator n=1 Tax=Oxalobacteraceae TaxID=75682 RepID=UPI0010A53F98|nr:helix-turn-helix domain-containing protein [Herbaspirillum sp. ST 5-3]